MIPDPYRHAHDDVDSSLADLKGLTNALCLITTEANHIEGHSREAQSINVLIRTIEAEIEKAEAHQKKAWTAILTAFKPRESSHEQA